MIMKLLLFLQSERSKTILKFSILLSKCFVLILVGILIYFLFSLRKGYTADPSIKLKIAQSIINLQNPEGYDIKFASNDVFSKLVVWDSPVTDQRITMNRVYWKPERTPVGFSNKYDHVGKTVRLRKTTFTGIENPRVEGYSILKDQGKLIPYVQVSFKNGDKTFRGMIFCVYDKTSHRTLFVESSGLERDFSEKVVLDFVHSLGTIR